MFCFNLSLALLLATFARTPLQLKFEYQWKILVNKKKKSTEICVHLLHHLCDSVISSAQKQQACAYLEGMKLFIF